MVAASNADTCGGWFFNSTGNTTDRTTKAFDNTNGSPTGPWGGNICANIYVFDPGEEELACCYPDHTECAAVHISGWIAIE